MLIARLPDEQDTADGVTSTASPGGGRWSPPSAIGIFGGGFGGQVGFELTDFVFIFNSASSLASFSKSGSLTVSGNISIAFGPLGRSAEIAGGVSGGGTGKMMSFAKTKGLFGGVSLESGVLVERRGANKRFYGGNVKTAEILAGRVVLENEEREGDAVRELMRALGKVFDASSARAGEERGLESAPAPAPAVPAAEPSAELPAEPVSAGPQLGQATQNTADAQEAVDGEAQAQRQPVPSG